MAVLAGTIIILPVIIVRGTHSAESTTL